MLQSENYKCGKKVVVKKEEVDWEGGCDNLQRGRHDTDAEHFQMLSMCWWTPIFKMGGKQQSVKMLEVRKTLGRKDATESQN